MARIRIGGSLACPQVVDERNSILNMECSYKYVEQAVVCDRQVVILQLGVWLWG